jgi:cell division protein FtsI (penicillin-binding protein 3)
MTHEGNEQKSASSRTPWRLRFFALLLLAGLAAVAVRLFVVQVLNSSEYRERARKQYDVTVSLRPWRGMILDREGRTIASSVQSVSYAVDPKMVQNPARICALLATASGSSADSLMAKIRAGSKRNFVWLARGLTVSPQTAALDTLNDVGFIRLTEPKRNYVLGSLAAQLVGCTDVDNRGLVGLELAYDSLLRGEAGFEVMQRDAKNHLRQIVGASSKPARNGYSLELTIDAELQAIVEEELQNGLIKAGAEGGIAIAISPRTGEILAMASAPSFNPNAVHQSSPDAMRLRGITDMYEPGSTFKLITAAAALEYGVINAAAMVNGLNGVLQLKDGTVVRDHEPLGVCTLRQALEKSSNIVFGNIARSMKDRDFYKVTRDFGFGIPIGFEMAGEARGILKTPAEYDYSTKLFMGFGYQMAATALQLAGAYATVANKGVMMKPYIVRGILDDNQQRVAEYQPQRIRQVVSAQTSAQLSDLFCSVVDRGTGVEARVPGLRIAGKTGTAQQLVEGKYSKQAYTASFIGYFPADSAELVVLVMLDKPKTDIYGGRTAAPIFRSIVQRILSTPSVHEDYPALSRVQIPSGAVDSSIIPDVRGMVVHDAKELLRSKFLRANAESESGVVQQQWPAPGTRVAPGSAVSIRCATAPAATSLQQGTTSAQQGTTSTQTATAPSGGQSTRQNAGALTSQQPMPHSSQTPQTVDIPDVRGLSVRRAVTILHARNVAVRIMGSGRVREQRMIKENGKKVCVLVAR